MLNFWRSGAKQKIALATELAVDELLGGKLPYSMVKTHASKLCLDGKQSAEMLATQAALWFFRNPGENFEELSKSQLSARVNVLKWHEEGKLPSLLLMTFETSLHKKYHPNNLKANHANEQS